jgi:hypothetical protein
VRLNAWLIGAREQKAARGVEAWTMPHVLLTIGALYEGAMALEIVEFVHG